MEAALRSKYYHSSAIKPTLTFRLQGHAYRKNFSDTNLTAQRKLYAFSAKCAKQSLNFLNLRIQSEGVLLEEPPPPSVAGEKYSEEILKIEPFDEVMKSEEEENGEEGTPSDGQLQDIDGQVEVKEVEEVKLFDDNLGIAEIVVIDEREEANKDILEPERSEESVVQEEPSPNDTDFETEVQFVAPFEAPLEVLFEPADVIEVDVKAEEETVEESKTETEDTLDISKAVVVKTPPTVVEEE